MRTRPWLTWLIFGLCAMAVVEGLGWVTWQAMRSEKREIAARAQAAFQETIRLALWRMESEVTPIIAQESARPYFQYRSFYAAEQAYTRMWQEVETGEVLVPSPLLESSGQFIKLHFQIEADGQVTSPQAPTGNMRDLAESQYVDGEFIVLAGQMLDELTVIVKGSQMASLMQAAREDEQHRAVPPPAQVAVAPQTGAEPPAQSGAQQQQTFGQSAQSLEKSVEASQKEFEKRKLAAESVYQNEAAGKKQTRGQTFADSNKPGADDRAAEVSKAEPAAPPAPAAVAASPPPGGPAGKDAGQLTDRAWAEGDSAAKRQSAVGPANEPPGAAAKPRSELREGLAAGATVDKRGGRERETVNAVDAEGKLDAARPDQPKLPRLKGYQGAGPRPGQEVETGPLKPVWLRNPHTGADELVMRRVVRIRGAETVQGFWMDWAGLRSRLTGAVTDLIPASVLRPAPTDSGQGALQALRLASLPVLLEPGAAGAAPAPIAGSFSTTHVTLAVTWLAVLAGIIAIGVVLRAAMELGERRGRFVSAVTHELRTPLTTFCLYTEMLADGMVSDEAKRREYFATLKGESRRLAGIVENVLDYARLGGERRSNGHARTDAGEMLSRIIPELRRCTERAGLDLEVGVDGAEGLTVAADTATVERVLLNLIENSCKYAAEAKDRRVHLTARRSAGRRGEMLEVRVRDHGPGIPWAEQRRVFLAFRRGKRDADSAKSGLGLGLALARGLARGFGGDLRLCRDHEDGAEFSLTLPCVPDQVAGAVVR